LEQFRHLELYKGASTELKTFEWNILNPDWIINLEIKNEIIWRLKMRGEQAIFNLEIKKKSGLSINPDIHHSKVFSSDHRNKT